MFHVNPDPNRRARMQIAACRLGIAIVLADTVAATQPAQQDYFAGGGAKVTLQSGIQTSMFGRCCNQNIEKVTLLSDHLTGMIHTVVHVFVVIMMLVFSIWQILRSDEQFVRAPMLWSANAGFICSGFSSVFHSEITMYFS